MKHLILAAAALSAALGARTQGDDRTWYVWDCGLTYADPATEQLTGLTATATLGLSDMPDGETFMAFTIIENNFHLSGKAQAEQGVIGLRDGSRLDNAHVVFDPQSETLWASEMRGGVFTTKAFGTCVR